MTRKIKMNKAQRAVIEEYGIEHIQSTIDRTKESELYQALIEGANKAIRLKYPEDEMVILHKYKQVREDRCLRFQFPSGRVDGINFKYGTSIADMPSGSGCYSGEVFPVDVGYETAFDDHAKVKQENDKFEYEKTQSFRAFLTACIYLDEVLEVIDLPDEIRERLGHRSTGLVAVTSETVAALRTTFKNAA